MQGDDREHKEPSSPPNTAQRSKEECVATSPQHWAPAAPPADPFPSPSADSLLLFAGQLEYILRWLDQSALPEDCEPVDSARGPVREESPEVEEDELETPEGPRGRGASERRLQELQIGSHRESQREPTELSFSLLFDQPSPSPLRPHLTTRSASSDTLPVAQLAGIEQARNISGQPSSP